MLIFAWILNTMGRKLENKIENGTPLRVVLRIISMVFYQPIRCGVSSFSFHQSQKVTKVGITSSGNSVVNTPCMYRATKAGMKHENGEFGLRGNANPSEESLG